MATKPMEASPAVEQAATKAAKSVVETKEVLTRQRYITFIILVLTAWVARGFLLPLAWASVLAIAE